MTTYRLDGMGGNMGRWFPSVEAAKEAYMLVMEQNAYHFDTEVPEVLFEPSTEHPDHGGECEAHVRILEGGRIQACIWPEKPEWPDPERRYHRGQDLGPAPDLWMFRTSYNVNRQDCDHSRLVCKNDARGLPVVECAMCGSIWLPGDR